MTATRTETRWETETEMAVAAVMIVAAETMLQPEVVKVTVKACDMSACLLCVFL
jgi:hypothetical protein